MKFLTSGTSPEYLLPNHILSVGKYSSLYQQGLFDAAGFSNTAYPAANLAIFVGLHLPGSFLVSRLFVQNATTLTGTTDLGLYDDSFKLLTSTGATARAGSGVVQYIDTADYYGMPGDYYLAIVLSSASGSLSATTPSFYSTLQLGGVLNQNLSSATLPAQASPGGLVFNFLPLMGFTQSATL